MNCQLFPIGLLEYSFCKSLNFTIDYFSPITRALFPQSDDEILTYREDENTRVEPVWSDLDFHILFSV